ncbi:hypothetical protein H2198_002274 [Neophaeococcomyces mojaviensis]|uniref:Uncharacterized protein n=1 Tax=Neophaeococcomyces mojaviensis TaxID=3383035 RepID=A0ACC3AF36_9EURO|nr:hypothetical protein H2198_002274 [Knufia sp. JES_112]
MKSTTTNQADTKPPNLYVVPVRALIFSFSDCVILLSGVINYSNTVYLDLANHKVASAPTASPMADITSANSTFQGSYYAALNTLLTTLSMESQLWAFKFIVKVIRPLSYIPNPSRYKLNAPNYTKSYPIRPSLTNSIFVPKTFRSGSRLPLVLDIHGGGWAAFGADDDDHFCRLMADKYSSIVVSIDYRLTPLHRFPEPVEDVAENIRAVLSDSVIPYDQTKHISLCGFSAGGSLALSVAQLPDLKSRITKIAPIYPLTDFTKCFRGPPKSTRAGQKDFLVHIIPMCTWGYVSPGQDLMNPLLSPVYASREDLPQDLFVITAECDFLRHEARAMAERLAGRELRGTKDATQQWEEKEKRVRSCGMPDQVHVFTHLERKGVEEVERNRLCAELYESLAAWFKA